MCGKLVVSLALLAAFTVCTFGFELTEEGKKHLQECQGKHSISPDEVVAAVKDKKLPESENGKCFMECVMEKFGVLNDGKFDPEKAKSIASGKIGNKPELLEKVNTVIDKCNAEVSNPGKCEYGVGLAKCAMKYAKEMNISEIPIGN
uniref:Odorant binding protein 45 n=1 Tax=Nezara viridula TaxID=85310 RepID=A0A4Y5RDN1_NEZVI|nr:odorant binding protein 45 [Nezara viridula]